MAVRYVLGRWAALLASVMTDASKSIIMGRNEFCFAIGHQRPGLRHMVFVTFGTGLGAGLIVNGQILHGATDTADEVGHWRLSDDGPIGYGKNRWSARTSVRELVELMLAGDEDAVTIATEAETWIRGVALLIDSLNPEVVVLGSLAVPLGERVLAPMRRVAKEALAEAAAACEIVPSVLGLEIGDVAALMAALNDPVVKKSLESNRA